MPSTFQKIAILGPGLLGGSVALSARDAGFEVFLWGRNPERVAAARGLNLNATTDFGEAVRGADLVVFAVPVGVMDRLAELLAGHLDPGALVTDVGSVKVLPHHVAATQAFPFVGSHPMAGSEQTGVEAARANLFEGAACVLTNDAGRPESEVAALEQFWKELGCSRVRLMAAESHDEAVARISHFPHAMSSLTADVSLKKEEHLELAGGGFRDTTRVAAGDPAMWAEIMIENRKALGWALEEARDRIGKMLDQLANSDKEGLQEFLGDVKSRKDLAEQSHE